eukprot:449614-Hanusia_phi.AAC.1
MRGEMRGGRTGGRTGGRRGGRTGGEGGKEGGGRGGGGAWLACHLLFEVVLLEFQKQKQNKQKLRHQTRRQEPGERVEEGEKQK